ncbi:beta 1-4 rhamnosyltransferase Cps2T [Niallia circulans]|uniref:beta 1-4 rhamnosyltransferase Cps2T n=1 Tax=Niallia circulans TaxID=1397 RepID=UPI001CFFB4F0|nr:DUF1972 domain-containing protein [Niallia circulans]MCB5237684.1 DUF1972 domain-containing protein [Niallia circulans]
MDIFIIGSKGIPAKYGGFETFVEYLTKNKMDKNINYHVSCMGKDKKEFYHNGARCFNIEVPNIGSSKAVLYDILSLRKCIEYIEENKLFDSIIYILACRIGPFFSYYKNKLNKLGVKVFVNPDGHEWKRSKWSYPVRKYWKTSERLMVKHADLLICDSKGIEEYINQDYSKYQPKTTFIAYGADISPAKLSDIEQNELNQWYKKFNILNKNYYLIVGRFVSENNYELMISEFIKSNTNKDLVIISNVEKNVFFNELLEKTKFDQDPRVKFVGTVYNQNILKKIRENAFAYIHGHEVGGTNPSLLEALASTNLNLLLDVNFNREVGEETAVYFNKNIGNLAHVIDNVEEFEGKTVNDFSSLSTLRIKEAYSWEKIVNDYENTFLNLH